MGKLHFLPGGMQVTLNGKTYIKKYEKTCKKKVNINITGKIKETINIDTCTNIRNLKKDIDENLFL